MYFKKLFSRKSFCWEDFLFGQIKKKKKKEKMKDTRKKQTEKEKREKHNKPKKIKGQLENRRVFALKKKMEQKSRGDKRSFVFFKETILSNEIFFKKTFER